MSAVGEPGPASGSDDPFERLGLSKGAGFEQVQAARERCLAETADDPQAKARVEAAYDAVLMARLRERQQGRSVQPHCRHPNGRSRAAQIPRPSPESVFCNGSPQAPSGNPTSLSGLARDGLWWKVRG